MQIGCAVASPSMNVLLLLLLFSTSIRSVAASVRSRHESDAVVEVAEPLSVVVVVAVAAQLLLLMLLLLGCCWLVLAELVVVVVLVVLDDDDEDVAPEGTGSSVRRRAISRSRNTSVSLGSIRLKRLEWKGGNV